MARRFDLGASILSSQHLEPPAQQASDVIDFTCPACKLACRVSGKQRAVQHQVPNCALYNKHRGNMQEFLKLALMAAGGGGFELGNAAIDAAEPRAAVVSDERKAELIDELSEGLKKL